MYIEKETEKALLMVRDAVAFWIQRRWLKADGSLTKAGWKAYHIAARDHWKHFSFNALKEFETARETEKAVLLKCVIEHGDGSETEAEFWLPKSMTRDRAFVSGKIREIEERHPFTGTRVRRGGNAVTAKQGNYPPGGKGTALRGGSPPSPPGTPGGFFI